jgi:hypothetical protein
VAVNVRTTVLDNYSAPSTTGAVGVTWLSWSLGLGVLTALWFVFSYGYIEDDAFIHLEFARSVAAGHGFAFNGMVTNGDTAPLWVLVLVTLHALGIEWVVSAKLACLLGLGSTVLAIFWLVRDLVAHNDSLRRLGPAAVAVTVLNPYFVHWSFSGMESVTAIGVSLWAIRATFVRPPSWHGALASVTLLGIGPLLRPELLLLAGIGVPVTLWRYWHMSQGETAVRRWSRLALLAALGALPVLLWCVYAQLTFGSPIPNTNMAKRGGALDSIAPRLAAVYAAGFLVTLVLFPLVALVRLLRGERAPAAVWILAAWPLLCVVFYLADHTLVQTRYCLLSMPCLGILTLWLLEDSGRPVLLRLAAGAMVLVSLLTVGLTVIPHVQNKKEIVRLYADLGSYLHSHVPKDAPVAVYAIGELAFKSGHPLVDVGGITRPSVIPYMSDPQATLAWAKRNGARYFISSHPPEAGAVPVYSTTVPFLGWTFKHSSYGATEPLTVYRLP